jgi:hypothetical protein
LKIVEEWQLQFLVIFRAQVGRLSWVASAASEASWVSRRIAAVIHAEIEQRLIAFGFVDHCGATLTATFVQPRSIGFAGKPA